MTTKDSHQKKAAYLTTASMAIDGLEGLADDEDMKKYFHVLRDSLKNLADCETEDAQAEDQRGLTPATLKAELAKALTESDPEVQEKIREFVLKAAAGALGDKIVPMPGISGVTTGYPSTVRPVYRSGQEPVAVKPNVPVEFAALVKVDD